MTLHSQHILSADGHTVFETGLPFARVALAGGAVERLGWIHTTNQR